jgi:hypothetical protein
MQGGLAGGLLRGDDGFGFGDGQLRFEAIADGHEFVEFSDDVPVFCERL